MLLEKLNSLDNWTAPAIPENIPRGDMPGDKIEINDGHIAKANTIFPKLIQLMKETAENNNAEKIVITVCGGSGVGKSETASLLTYYLNNAGIGAYTLSGDNYPRRIPVYNDAERLHEFREAGIRGMIKDGEYSKERFDIIHEYQLNGMDADPAIVNQYPWYKSYLTNGREGLKGYLGTTKEIGFDDLTDIIKEFKSGREEIWMKRMGRTDTELWYESVNCKDIQVLLIEWTHGNSDNYSGVDIPILLNSTPKETLAHRKARNRDGATDSPFTTMVLEIEQGMLETQAPKAKIIISKSGDILSFEDYRKLMDMER